MSESHMPNPGPVMQALNAYWVSGALKGALELDLFTHIGSGQDTIEALVKATGASERGVRAVANAMCALEFLDKKGERFALTPVADAFLRSDRPSFVGGFHRFVQSETFWQAFRRVGEAARKGTSIFEEDALTPENELWTTFAESSLPMAMGTASLLPPLVEAHRPKLRILDVAAGSGGYGITLAQASPESEVTFLDWPNVLEVTRRHADQLGVGDRARYLEGDALKTDLGGPYDIVVAGNFLHHFGPGTCVEFLRRVRPALGEGGVFATSEFVPDEERKQPGVPLLFAVAMLVWTDEGDAYTFPELRSFLTEAGFSAVEHHTFGDMPSSWVTAR